ncbi:MAG TPA: uroporphyrinogen-III C-methyltransferase [Ktedonobacteraceae bacterium]|nr:uroporphyrinogen-III C-methyltransferase [Ktedonobacteraceae bacterium]
MHHEYISSLSGIVYLVGAGPGDPGLITVKGLAALRSADVVVYDYLANPAFLQEAKEGAQKIYAGKSAGTHTLSQQEINQLLIEHARVGKIVVRLKGGDPFVFGRGGEEAEALVEHGIRWEVIPGVTSAVAVPAYAGIPVTHREYSSIFTVVTGSEGAKGDETAFDWEALVRLNGTLIFLMGVSKLSFITQQLMYYGCSASTPVAVIRWGSMPDQQIVPGTLSTIVALVEQAQLKPPAVIVVGKVAQMAHRLQWFDLATLANG